MKRKVYKCGSYRFTFSGKDNREVIINNLTNISAGKQFIKFRIEGYELKILRLVATIGRRDMLQIPEYLEIGIINIFISEIQN